MSETVILLIGAWLALNFVVVPAARVVAARLRGAEPSRPRPSELLSAEAYVSILPSRLIVQACRILGADSACLLVGVDDGGYIVAGAHGIREEVIGERLANQATLRPLGDATAAVMTTACGRGVVLSVVAANGIDARDSRERRLLTQLTGLVAAGVEDANPSARFERAVSACAEGLAEVERERDAVSEACIDLIDVAARVGTRLGLDHGALIELQLGARFYEISALNSGPIAGVDPDTGEPTWLSAPDPGEMAVGIAHLPGFEAVALVAGLLGECWDGSGYPHGLRAARIPLASRILAACGAVWTLTTNPPVGAGAPMESALRCVQAASGAVFDPTVVMALSEELLGEIPQVGDVAVAEWARADALYSVVE